MILVQLVAIRADSIILTLKLMNITSQVMNALMKFFHTGGPTINVPTASRLRKNPPFASKPSKETDLIDLMNKSGVISIFPFSSPESLFR